MDRCEISRVLYEHGYYLVDRLGGGTEGEVFLVAEQGHPYACKILRPGRNDLVGRSNELEILKKLSTMGTSGFPAYRESFVAGTAEYIVMEYIQGSDLATYLRGLRREEEDTSRNGRGDWNDLDEIMRIAHSLTKDLILLNEYDGGYVYGDLKPDNVIIQKDTRVRLIDLGGVTPVGGVRTVGNLAFGSPDSFYSATSGRVEDIYAMGRLLEYMLGWFPNDKTYEETMIERRKDNRRNKRKWLEMVISRCLSPEPSRRVSDMRQLAEYLRRGLMGRANGSMRISNESCREYMAVQSTIVYGAD